MAHLMPKIIIISRAKIYIEGYYGESSDIEQLDNETTKKATRALRRLDSKANTKKSMQSKQQTLQRVVGENSTRPWCGSWSSLCLALSCP